MCYREKQCVGPTRLDCADKIGLQKRQKHGPTHFCFHVEEDFFFFKENLCDQGSGGKFSWQKLKQTLSCFDSFPVAFLANGGKRN